MFTTSQSAATQTSGFTKRLAFRLPRVQRWKNRSHQKKAPVETETLGDRKCPTFYVLNTELALAQTNLVQCKLSLCAVKVEEADFLMEQWLNHGVLIQPKFKLAGPQAWEIHHKQPILCRSFPDKERGVFESKTSNLFLEIGYVSITENPFWEGQRKRKTEKQYSKKWYNSEMQLPK